MGWRHHRTTEQHSLAALALALSCNPSLPCVESMLGHTLYTRPSQRHLTHNARYLYSFQLLRARPAYCPSTLHIQLINSFSHQLRISKSLHNLSNHTIAHLIFQSQTLRIAPTFLNLTILITQYTYFPLLLRVFRPKIPLYRGLLVTPQFYTFSNSHLNLHS